MTPWNAAPSARETAAGLLERALEGQAPFGFEEMDLPLDALGPADRRLAHEIVLGTLRRLPALDAALAPFLRQPLDRMDPPLRALLRTAAYQLRFLDRVPDYAVVSESVKIARRRVGPRAAGFVNAVLRKVAAAPPARPEGPAEAHCHPEWLVERWLRHWPEADLSRWMAESNRTPPVHVTVWTPRISLAAFLDRARAEGGEPSELFPAPGGGSQPGGRLPVVEIAAGPDRASARAPHDVARSLAAEGLCFLQDAGAALAALAVPDRPYRRVLDLCAAPGGKAFVLAMRFPGAWVTAADRSPARLRALEARRAQLGAGNVRPVAADAVKPPFREGAFDLVLADVPCSGTGTLRRNPDLRWKLTPERIVRLPRLQAAILEAAASLTAPGGVLAYVTCSAEPEENEDVVERFRGSRGDRFRPVHPGEGFRAWTTPAGHLRTFPSATAGEGFFCALFERTGG
ncbi:MAG: methyltransferase domain-containing protein [Acidobacteria bacterium]|nr:methyltransferase domain-containing protein [Acidobacteriota bacterium]